MEYLEGFEELFGLDITNDYLTESFNTGPITFQNLFEETDLRTFDSIPDDISSFLNSETTEVEEDIKITEDVFNIHIENVNDMNNNKCDSEDTKDNFSLWDNLDLGIEGGCHVKQELMESSEIDMKNKHSVSPPSLVCNFNEVPFIDFDKVPIMDHNPMSKTANLDLNEIKEERTNKNIKEYMNKTIGDQNQHNGVNIVENSKLKAKYSILPIVTHDRAEDKKGKHKKGNQSPVRKSHIKDSKSFHYCHLCPFKTKEKSIIRMHQSFVHKMEVIKSEKKISSQKSETIGRSSRHDPPKDYQSNKSQTIAIKKLAPVIRSSTKKLVKPTQKSFNLPTVQNGLQGIRNENVLPNSTLQCLQEVKVETAGSQLFTLTPSGELFMPSGVVNVNNSTPNSELFLPSGVVNVVNCKVIEPAPKKPVSILPKQPDYIINTFHQINGNISEKSNVRLLRNNQERQRRNENKSALDAVKDMVPKLRYLTKPSKVTILNETMEYVKILQKTEKADLEEWEAQKKKFIKLKSKYKSYLL